MKLKSAGLNHRDLFIMNNRREMQVPLVLGSDGAGIVTEVGEGVSGDLLQTEVIINPSIGWDHIAEIPELPEVLGGPKDGTFAEYVIVPAENVVAKPSYLTWEESGVLSLSALTAYRALLQREIKAWGTCFNSWDRRRCSDICHVICKSNWCKSKCYFKGREQKKVCRNIWRRLFF